MVTFTCTVLRPGRSLSNQIVAVPKDAAAESWEESIRSQLGPQYLNHSWKLQSLPVNLRKKIDSYPDILYGVSSFLFLFSSIYLSIYPHNYIHNSVLCI
jgi:hypothetical protein